MAIREIITYPNPILRKPCEALTDINDEIICLSEDMVETMKLARGAGLAAVQVAVPKRLIVLEPESEKKTAKPLIVINPVIVEESDEETAEEGCLSLPDFVTKVKRAEKVTVRGLDRNAKPLKIEAQGILAVALQHEIDHLDGTLILDRAGLIKREFYKKRLSKAASR